MTPATALVLGDYRQTLTVVRALAARGMSVVVGHREGRRSQTRYSRHVAGMWAHPPIGDGLAAALRDALTRFEPSVVFPVGDLEIAWLAGHRADIPGVPIAAPDPAITAECQDKTALLGRAARLGIPHAPFRLVSDPAGLREAFASIGYPCFVKPHDPLLGLFESKGVRCDGPETAAARFARWPEGHRRLIVQRYDHGPRHNVYFAAREGELIGIVEVGILRTDRPDGSGLAVDGIVLEPSPGPAEDTALLVADLHYTGVGCTQFLVAPDGARSFLELNPRLGANYVVAHAAGLDLASMAVDLAMGREVAPTALRSGIRYAWTLGDLQGLKGAIRRGEVDGRGCVRWLGETIRSARHADVHVTWRLDDPLPSIVLAHRTIIAPLARRLVPRRRR